MSLVVSSGGLLDFIDPYQPGTPGLLWRDTAYGMGLSFCFSVEGEVKHTVVVDLEGQ